MTLKRKPVKFSKSAQEDSEAENLTNDPVTESTPVVTQVVEVVDDKASEAGVDAPATNQISSTEPPVVASTVESPQVDVLPESQLTNDKKREIEGLFQASSPQTAPVSSQANIIPEISMHKRGTSRAFLFGLAAALLVVIFVGGGALVITQGTVKLPGIDIKPTPTTAISPTSVPTPIELNKAELTIQVLNGGGVSGAASKMKGFLESKGYKVSSTGNTEEYSYESTEIWVKASKIGYLKLLEEDLSGEYTIGTSSATLSESATSDARIIVGKN